MCPMTTQHLETVLKHQQTVILSCEQDKYIWKLVRGMNVTSHRENKDVHIGRVMSILSFILICVGIETFSVFHLSKSCQNCGKKSSINIQSHVSTADILKIHPFAHV